MNSYILRINCNHLKREINKDYMGMRNHFYLCTLASICVYNSTKGVIRNMLVEDAHYQRVLEQALSTPSIEEAISFLGVLSPPHMFLDVHDLVEEFFCLKFNPNKQNYLSVSIDSGYHMVVNLKVL